MPERSFPSSIGRSEGNHRNVDRWDSFQMKTFELPLKHLLHDFATLTTCQLTSKVFEPSSIPPPTLSPPRRGGRHSSVSVLTSMNRSTSGSTLVGTNSASFPPTTTPLQRRTGESTTLPLH